MKERREQHVVFDASREREREKQRKRDSFHPNYIYREKKRIFGERKNIKLLDGKA